MTHTQKRPLEVWKFGGASLADAAAIRRAAALIASHKGPLVVVASALGGITDLLLGGARRGLLRCAPGNQHAAMRVMFAIYIVLIAAGLVTFTIIGLTHH